MSSTQIPAFQLFEIQYKFIWRSLFSSKREYWKFIEREFHNDIHQYNDWRREYNDHFYEYYKSFQEFYVFMILECLGGKKENYHFFLEEWKHLLPHIKMNENDYPHFLFFVGDVFDYNVSAYMDFIEWNGLKDLFMLYKEYTDFFNNVYMVKKEKNGGVETETMKEAFFRYYTDRK
jgi:hypothetical protein